MIWIISRHYNTDERMGTLLEMISEILIYRIKNEIKLSNIIKLNNIIANETIILVRNIFLSWSNNYFHIRKIIEDSVNNALLSIVAFDVYNDLVYLKYYQGLNNHQQILVLVLLIIGFMASIKILQLLISN